MILLVIASLFLCPVLGDPIVGGHVSDILLHPWLASIQSNGYHNCAGSILSEHVVLTTAHCVKEVTDTYIVRVGSSRTDSGGSWHRIVEITIHENYSKTNKFNIIVNDVALIKVSPPFNISRHVRKIALAEKGSTVRPGTNVIVAGWGSEVQGGGTSLVLKSTNLSIIDSDTCARAYGDYRGKSISSNHQICAAREGTDTCSGDSGDPLILGDVQIGIKFTGNGCGNSKYPGIYLDVAYYRDWIDTNHRLLTDKKLR